MYLRLVRLRAHLHGAFSCICKNVLSYWCFVLTDPVFWEPETAIIWKVDKSENVSLAFSCVQPIRIFCETMITSLSATTTWTNNVFLLPNINTDQYMYCSMFVFFLLCWVCIQRTGFMRMLQVVFSVLVYLYGRITAPHTCLACILHRFESVSVVLCADISWDDTMFME